jgi:ketosteroid isomerase-like protein
MKKVLFASAWLLAAFMVTAQIKSNQAISGIKPDFTFLYYANLNQNVKTMNFSKFENSIQPQDLSSETIAAVERFNEAFNRHDVNAVMAAMTEDCIFENTNPVPDGKRFTGAAEVKAYWEKFFTNNPDAKFETEEIFAAGDRCVVLWIYRKTRDGQPWHLRGVDVFKVRNGKVAEKFSYVKG